MNIVESSVGIARGQMDYIRFGSGKKTLVMIAGMTMTGLTGLAEPVAQAFNIFTEKYTVYLFNRCSVLPEGYSVRDMAADMAEAMDALGLRDADVLGVSQGGMIGLWLAIDRPALVHALVLACSGCYQNDVGKATFSRWAALGDDRDGQGLYRDFFPRVYTHPDPAALAALENTATDEQCRRFAVMARACYDFDCRDALDGVRCPVLVIGASEDKVLSADVCREAAEALGCALYIYPSYGHAAYDEAPDFKQRVLAFLDSVG